MFTTERSVFGRYAESKARVARVISVTRRYNAYVYLSHIQDTCLAIDDQAKNSRILISVVEP